MIMILYFVTFFSLFLCSNLSTDVLVNNDYSRPILFSFFFPKNKHNYPGPGCRYRETLQYLCEQIPGDALLYSMFKENAEPVKCPLKGKRRSRHIFNPPTKKTKNQKLFPPAVILYSVLSRDFLFCDKRSYVNKCF